MSSQFELPQSETDSKAMPITKMFRINPAFDDLKLILKQLGDKLFSEKKKRNVRILTNNEVENYYHAMKR